MNVPIVSIPIREATSPAWWPPIPSHTARMPSPTRMLSSLRWRRLPTSVRPQNWIIPQDPLVGSQIVAIRGRPRPRRAESAQLKRHTGDFRNLELLARSKRSVQGEAIHLGDDLAAQTIAIVELRERGAAVARPDGVHDRQDLAHLVLQCLEGRAVRWIETQRDEQTLLGLTDQAPPQEGLSLLDERRAVLRDPTLQPLLGVLSLTVSRVDRERNEALLERLPEAALLLQLIRAVVVSRRQGVPRPSAGLDGRRGRGPCCGGAHGGCGFPV